MRSTDDPAPAGGQHEIRLLGPFTVLRDGRPLAERDLGSRKARTLLRRLLVERGNVVGVDALTGLLWPDRSPLLPERHVATLVSRLRASLGREAIERVGDGYRFGGRPPAYVLDVADAERLTGEAEARLGAGEPGLGHIAASRALALLGRGDLLVDEPYADWVLPARAAASALLARARRAAWAAAFAIHDFDAAVGVAEAALADEPFDEAACRAVMRAHHARGQPGLALAAYDRLRRLLADELGADPAEETRELHLRILRREPVGTGLVAAARTGPRPASADLVGRDVELSWLHELWSRAAAGIAQVALLVGEAGIGKTRLAAEAVQLAERTGGTVAQARCYEAEQSLLLQPIADALRSIVVASSPQLVREAVGEGASSLVTLIPEVTAVAEPYERRHASPEVERRRIFEAAVGFVRALAERGPLLLFLDDLHMAGASTLEFVHFLHRRTARCRVLVLGTARIEEGREVLDLLDDVALRLELRPLASEAIEELAKRCGMVKFAQRIAAATRGHPLFVVETLRALAEQPQVSGDLSVPESLRTAVVARMRRAGPQVEELIRAAATLGSSVDTELLAWLTGESAEETARAAEAACRARLLTEAGTSYEFANDLIQEIVYQTTQLPLRVARHRRAAQLLAGNPEAVAHHAVRAGDWSTAVDASLEAADIAARRYANREAERLLEQAIHAAVRAGDQVGVARARLARGRIRETLADYQGAYEDHLAVVALARPNDRPDLELAALNQLGGDLLVGLGRPTRDCIPYLESALAIADATNDLAAQVDILGRLTVIWTNRLRFDVARNHADRAVALAESHGDATVRALALDAVKNTMAYSGDVAGLETVLPALRSHLRGYRQGLLRYRGPGLEAWALFESAFPALARARWSQAAARIDEALSVTRESGYVAYESPFLAHLAWVERARGRYGEALRLARRAAELAGEIGHPWWVALAETVLGWVLTEIGAAEEACDRLARGLAAAERDATEGYLLRCLGHQAWATALRGDHDKARRLAERAEGLFVAATGAVFLHGAHTVLAAAEARAACDDRAAARLLRQVRTAAAEADWVEIVAWADLLRARCHLTDSPQRATRLATEALAVARRSELPHILWQAHGLLAALARVDGDAADLAVAQDTVNALAASLEEPHRRATFRAVAEQRLRSMVELAGREA